MGRKSAPAVPLTCHVCGATFLVHPYRVRSARFCSKDCRVVGVMGARPASLRQNRVCEHCGRGFWAWPSTIRVWGAKYCSRACLGAARSARWRVAFASRLGAFVPAPADKACLGPCRLWTGQRDDEGYAILSRRGASGAASSRATHSAWEYYTGTPVPPGLYVMHWCNVPGCVAEGHLAPGTPLENMQQKLRDGRHRWGGYPHLALMGRAIR
jgi:hypothetical protein